MLKFGVVFVMDRGLQGKWKRNRAVSIFLFLFPRDQGVVRLTGNDSHAGGVLKSGLFRST